MLSVQCRLWSYRWQCLITQCADAMKSDKNKPPPAQTEYVLSRKLMPEGKISF